MRAGRLPCASSTPHCAIPKKLLTCCKSACCSCDPRRTRIRKCASMHSTAGLVSSFNVNKSWQQCSLHRLGVQVGKPVTRKVRLKIVRKQGHVCKYMSTYVPELLAPRVSACGQSALVTWLKPTAGTACGRAGQYESSMRASMASKTPPAPHHSNPTRNLHTSAK